MATARTDSATKIGAAVLELLRTRGPSAVTIEGVAERSGVARTTIYRRFADRNEMLTDALRGLAHVGESATHDGSGAGRLRWVVEHAASMILDGIGYGGFAALLTDADPAFTAAFRSVLQAHRKVLADQLQSGVDDGTLRLSGDIETTVDSLVGALLAEYARTGALAGDWVDRVIAVHSGLIVAD